MSGSAVPLAATTRIAQLQGLQVSQDVANIAMLERQCAILNMLESQVDAEGGLEAPSAPMYEQLLGDWRGYWRGARPQPSCRVEGLGVGLCRAGARLPPVDAAAWNLTNQWASHMHELTAREREAAHCREFARFHENGWLPPLWQWAEHTPGLDGALLEELVADPEYSSYYARAAGQALAFGSPAVEVIRRPEGEFRRKRVQELIHFRVLRRAAGVDVRHLTHVVEFGGGTGETVAAMRDLGFAGRHVVVDLPPMVLLQRYWLRYSGLPAYLGDDLAGAGGAAPSARPGIVLESAFSGGLLGRHLADADPRRSLFLGLWSLTEAGLGARAKVWPLLAACGIILLAFGNEFDGVDNAQYLNEELERWGFMRTYQILCWHLVHSPGHYYLLAVRRDIGTIHCLEELNCRDLTRHYKIARGVAR